MFKFLSVLALSISVVACTSQNEAQQALDKMNKTIDPIVKNLNKETLIQKYNELQNKIKSAETVINTKKTEAEAKAKELEVMLKEAKQNTEEKINEVKATVDQAKKAYEDAKIALAALNKAADDLKSSLTPGN